MTINHLEIVVTGLLVDLEEGDEGGAGELEGGDYFDRGEGDLFGLVGTEKRVGKEWLLVDDWGLVGV